MKWFYGRKKVLLCLLVLFLTGAAFYRYATTPVNLHTATKTVDIPKGAIKEPTVIPGKYLYGYAQWVIIKDLTNKVLYYKTYENTAWRSIDLKKFDLAHGKAVMSMALAASGPLSIDVSGKLKPNEK